SLSAGSVVTIQQLNGKLVVQKDAMTIAVLSKNAGQKWQERYKNIHSATVIAMIARYKADSEEEYQSRGKVEQWDVPMLEVVLS
ncbi:MAG: hypothetical protein Q7U30_08940, partial [Methylicorpusculum sp.]|nr:hypothetical protein [Methylicorpusculum sp.]